MKKIESLTEAQTEAMMDYQVEAIQIGLATGKTNREVVIPAFNSFLKNILNVPVVPVVFVRSPLEAQKFVNLATAEDLSNWDTKNNDALVESICSRKGKIKPQQSHSYSYGQYETYWIQFYKFFQNELKIEFPETAQLGLDIFETLSKNSGVHFICEECVVVSDRHKSISMENGQLHNEEGPAIEFYDGYKIFAIDGHVVTEQIVLHPETLTVEQIDNISNTETKRIAIQRFGVSLYLSLTEAVVIDKDSLDLKGSATRMLMDDKNGNRWLACSDGSTGRMYFLPVTNEVSTCKQAHEEISGLIDESDVMFES